MKQPYYARYSTEVPKSPVSGSLDGANLVYINVPQLDSASPQGNICITDLSSGFIENTIQFANSVTQFTSNLGQSNTNNVLVTNVYSNAANTITQPIPPINKTIPVTPLWYVYTFLPGFPLSSNPNGTFAVTLIDNKGNTIPSYHVAIQYINNIPTGIYTDIINTLDTWYQVVYLSNGTQVTKLLSSEPLFTLVDSFSTASYEYMIQYNNTSNVYQIITNSSNDTVFSILNIGTTKISVQQPIHAANDDPWYVTITNGYFKRFVDSTTYQYYLPEYYIQPFTPFIPANYQVDETPIFISNNTIRLRQIPLLPTGSITDTGLDINGDIQIYIRYSEDRTHNVNLDVNYIINTAGGLEDIAPFTANNPVEQSAIWCRLSIEDVDRTTGLVRINGIVTPNGQLISNIPNDNLIFNNDTLEAFYYYNEINLVFNKISLNPLFDQALLDDGISIYIVPAQTTLSPATSQPTPLQSVTNYIRFDSNEIIIDASDPTVPIGQLLTAYYTNLNTTIPSLELARIFVRNTATLNQITKTNLIDTRIIGGQLLDNLPPEIINLINQNTNDMYYLRDWNGQVLPGNSVIVMKLPMFLLNEDYTVNTTQLTGTNLTDRMLDIRRTCKKHLAFGVLPLIRFYDNHGNIQYNLTPPLDRIYF